MVNFNIDIEINDIIAESPAVTLLYVNELKICSLSDENVKFLGSMPISDNKVYVSLKSTYFKNYQTSNIRNPLKKSLHISFFLFLIYFLLPNL